MLRTLVDLPNMIDEMEAERERLVAFITIMRCLHYVRVSTRVYNVKCLLELFKATRQTILEKPNRKMIYVTNLLIDEVNNLLDTFFFFLGSFIP